MVAASTTQQQSTRYHGQRNSKFFLMRWHERNKNATNFAYLDFLPERIYLSDMRDISSLDLVDEFRN